MSLATEQGKKFALEALKQRRANKPKRIDNSSLYAGSPMYYYCCSCGHLSDVVSEGDYSGYNDLCKECRALKKCGWLE